MLTQISFTILPDCRYQDVPRAFLDSLGFLNPYDVYPFVRLDRLDCMSLQASENNL